MATGLGAPLAVLTATPGAGVAVRTASGALSPVAIKQEYKNMNVFLKMKP